MNKIPVVIDSNKETIMLVDDTPTNMDLLGQMLQSNGYQIVTISSGSQALTEAAQTPPDLILLDINMPEMNGYEVCGLLKADEKLKEIPVIFISGLDDTTDKIKAFSVGGVDYVAKPFRFEEILARVKTHLSLCFARRELKKQNEILQENMRLRDIVDRIARHDLKSPLSSFLLVPEMLLDAPNLTSEQKDLLKMLAESAHRLSETVHRSLDIYKMEQGTYQLTPGSVDVIKIIREVFRELGGLANSKNLSFVVLLDQKPVEEKVVFELQGENFLFFSILSNLIKNAIEASPDDKEILISLSTSPVPTISIKNFGTIPPQIHDRLFQRYVTCGKSKGTGLGMFSARLMARTLGGELTFLPDEVGCTKLILTLSPNSGTLKIPAKKAEDQ
ncbi:MAG: hybrid sensor histidine kinase/response regulator [Candidatus Riflebacteria bacterium]|nr:hybrid sensor histidine kinase/response regulator [Candidatus Riflebacteria bacterium]